MKVAAHFRLVKPAREFLDGFVAAVEAGWSPSTSDPEAGRRAVEKIRADADAYLASLDDRDGRGPPTVWQNGVVWPRIPGFARWLWDGEFCGAIALRWTPGSNDPTPLNRSKANESFGEEDHGEAEAA